MKNIDELAIGALLHDIGKVAFRSGDGREHSLLGEEFLSDFIENREILNSVKYHHAKWLKGANIPNNSSAYITYIADNIASGTDRRNIEGEEKGFIKNMPLATVFNILNGNSDKRYTYSADTLEFRKGINYPTVIDKILDESYYKKILINIKDALKRSDLSNINSIMEVMESNLSYVPSSTDISQVPDISLFDHCKLTACIALCIKQWLEANGIVNYKEALWDNAKGFYEENAFLLYSFDLSGIQSFLYTVGNSSVLKALRTRSFYLEILVEHIADELLTALGLYRSNLIYTGGGHAYMLLPNTVECKKVIEKEAQKINDWLIKEFNIELYMAYAYQETSANALMNKITGQYEKIYKELSRKLSAKKLQRYNAEEIRRLNSNKVEQDERECSVCHRTDRLNENGLCHFCESFVRMSNELINNKYFAIVEGIRPIGLELPNEKTLIPVRDGDLLKLINEDKVVRFYTKNGHYTGSKLSTSLWMGDYTTKSTFEEFANESAGINRIGVLRADVDNLGRAFVQGFEDKYDTISRTTTFSRQLSLFFKFHINDILSNGKFHLTNTRKERLATIVYSGGDDVFIVGSFDSILEIAVDINEEFKKFSLGKLTLSAGLGIFSHSYPLRRIASEVLELEELSKSEEGKNSITLFDNSKEHTYDWETFKEYVLDEKYRTIKEYFDLQSDHGKSYIYKLISYIRNTKDKISIPRFLYLISRTKPEVDEIEKMERYKNFAEKMFDWIESREDRRQLLTAMYLYVYLTREEIDK